MDKLHVFCGKMAAGKSTLAQSIASEINAIQLSEDELLLGLYPNKVTDVPTYVKYSNLIKQTHRPHFVALLRQELHVVFDFPCNTHSQRQWFMGIAHEAGVSCALHMIECTDELCLARMKIRAAENPERRSTDTVDMFNAISSYYERPLADEGFNIVKHVAA